MDSRKAKLLLRVWRTAMRRQLRKGYQNRDAAMYAAFIRCDLDALGHQPANGSIRRAFAEHSEKFVAAMQRAF